MSGFFDELKRRKVYRVAIAYIVASWALAQGIDRPFVLRRSCYSKTTGNENCEQQFGVHRHNFIQLGKPANRQLVFEK